MRPAGRGRGVAHKRARAEHWGEDCKAAIRRVLSQPAPPEGEIDWALDQVWRAAKVAASFAADIVGRERQ